MFNTSLNNGGGDRVGTIKAWGGSTAPAGWLICDGAAISRTLYAGLFAVIGETYGAGDGSTTFNLPDVGGFLGGNLTTKGNGTPLRYYKGGGFSGDYRLIGGNNSTTAMSNSGNDVWYVVTDQRKACIVLPVASNNNSITKAIIKY